MKKTKKYFSITLLLFLNFAVFGQQSTLDLTQSEQQKDFLKYLRTTISLLQDSSLKEMHKGYKLDSLSFSDKQQIAYKMKDTSYFKRLYEYFDFMKILEKKYHISQFSPAEWREVAQFGTKHGIYFIAPKKNKDTLTSTPYYFPIIPLKKSTDTTHILDFPQK